MADSNPESATINTTPPSNLFTYLPDLYLLILRIQAYLTQTTNSNNNTNTNTNLNLSTPTATLSQSQPTSNPNPTSQPSQTQTQTQSQTSLLQPPPSTTSLTFPLSSTAPILPSILGGPLDPKDLPSQIYQIRQTLLKSREAIRNIPDVKRTVEEQEREIQELEGFIGRLNSRLDSLGGIARREVNGKRGEDEESREEGDVVMGD